MSKCTNNFVFISFLFLFFIFDQGALAQIIQPVTFTINVVPGASNPNTNIPFFPSPVNLPVGSTVKWINTDTSLHTITSFNNAFDSPILGPNQSFNYTFINVGYYNYYCRLHPFMNGVIAIS